MNGCRTLASLVFCAFLFVPTLSSSSLAARPNILFMTADDLGVEIGCYGDQTATTPNMDRLANEGVKFTRAYVTQASCSSSRSSMLTGLYPHTNGQVGLSHRGYRMFRDDIPTLPKELKSAGYFTGVIGKIHIAPESSFPFDYRRINYPEARDAELVAERFGEFLELAGRRPWFMMLNFTDPHHPLLNDFKGRPKTKVTPDDVTVFPWLRRSFQKMFTVQTDPAGMQHEIAGYYNSINRLDEAVGLVLDRLQRSGESDNTLVVLIGDHGAPLPGAKLSCYEAGARIPFLLRWPGRADPGSDATALVSTVDLMPTFLDAAARPRGDGGQGRSLLPLLDGGTDDWRTTLATEFTSHLGYGYLPTRSVRDDRFKLIVNYLNSSAIQSVTIDGKTIQQLFPMSTDRPHFELYDLLVDPYEQHNLVDQSPEHVQNMLEKLEAWQRATDDPLRSHDYLLELTRQHVGMEKQYTGTVPDGF